MAKKTEEGACPVCGKPTDETYKPFCGKRCADVDLNRWLGETYRVPTDEPAIANDPYAQED